MNLGHQGRRAESLHNKEEMTIFFSKNKRVSEIEIICPLACLYSNFTQNISEGHKKEVF